MFYLIFVQNRKTKSKKLKLRISYFDILITFCKHRFIALKNYFDVS